MSAVSSAKRAKKKGCEYWQDLWEKYQKSHPGAFGVEQFTEWLLDNGHTNVPKVDPKTVLHRQIRKALREIRIKDPDGVIVRGMLPAKTPIVDRNGNMVFDVQYDHIHRMSADHALLAFEQRDENIGKQQRSASRDLQSFLRHNPNAEGHEKNFVFAFMQDEPEPQIVQKIARPLKKSKGKEPFKP
jgi:hypothetical protein